MTGPIFMDHHSTTPVDPRVLSRMLPYFSERFGNAASRSHAFGGEAEDAVELARNQVARAIGAASAREIVFTSGATESDNLAIKGVAEAHERGHIITCATEHKAVLDSCRHVERANRFAVTYLGVERDGSIDLDRLRAAFRPETVLVSIMLANNEVGTVHPIAAIGALTRERGVLFHCDAVQGIGRVPFDVEAMGVDLASISGHKIYGPKGIGALYVRKRTRIVAQIDGGGHERGMRSGTLNVPGIVGLGEAAAIALREPQSPQLRDRLYARLTEELEQVVLHGPPLDRRHPGNLNVSFVDVESEALMLALRDVVAVSSGSACTSASVEPSYVLRAMGIADELADGSIRFGIGRSNTEAEIDYVAERVIAEVERLRAASPVWQMRARGEDPSSIDW